jgi:hypothetical protein
LKIKPAVTGAGIMFEWLFRKKNKKKAKDQTSKLTKDNKGASMNKDYEFVVKLADVNPNYLVKIDGSNGVFYLIRRGFFMGQGELGTWYFYGDHELQFFFSVLSESGNDDSVGLYNVTRIETAFGGGFPVRLTPKQKAVVEQNIYYAFTTREPNSLELITIKAEYNVIFSWDC